MALGFSRACLALGFSCAVLLTAESEAGAAYWNITVHVRCRIRSQDVGCGELYAGLSGLGLGNAELYDGFCNFGLDIRSARNTLLSSIPSRTQWVTYFSSPSLISFIKKPRSAIPSSSKRKP